MSKIMNVLYFSVITCACFVSSCSSPPPESKSTDAASLDEILEQDNNELLILNPKDSAITRIALKAEDCGTLDEQFPFIENVSLLSSRDGILYVIEQGGNELWSIDWKSRQANKEATLTHITESMYDMSISQNRDIVVTTSKRIYVYGNQITSFVNLHGITNVLADREYLLAVGAPLKEVNLESDRGWTLTKYRYNGTEISRHYLPIDEARVNESWEDIFVAPLGNKYAIVLQNSADYITSNIVDNRIELKTFPHKALSLMTTINRKMIKEGERYQVLMIVASVYGDSLLYIMVGDSVGDYLVIVDQRNVLRGIVELGRISLRLRLPKIAIVNIGKESYCFITINNDNRNLAAVYRFANSN